MGEAPTFHTEETPGEVGVYTVFASMACLKLVLVPKSSWLIAARVSVLDIVSASGG